MKYPVPVRLRIEKDVITRVARTLKGKGEIFVKAGQQVAPDEIIGNGTISSGFRTLNLSTLLSVSPGEVEKLLTRKLGQRIYKGELLAFKKGWILGGKKIVTSPTDGILDFFNNKTGEIKISFLPKKADLPAGVYGIVEQIDVEKGQVIIRTQVSKVHGVFGSGRFRDGTIHILSDRDKIISEDNIQTQYYDKVLVGDSLFFKETISASISLGVSGMIVGGINARDYRGMASGRLVFPRKLDNDIGISIVVCEGFGSVPIGGDIFEILAEYENKFVFIDGNKALINLPSFSSSSLTKIKNTQLPPIQAGAQEIKETNETTELKIGQQVRIIGNSYLGEQGKIQVINEAPTLLPSGIKAFLATVETKRRKVQIPVANLEVIL